VFCRRVSVEGIVEKIKMEIKDMMKSNKFIVKIVAGVAVLLFLLSFFIDIGFVLVVIIITTLYIFANKAAEEDGDVLKVEKNHLIRTLKELEVYLEQHPEDEKTHKKISEVQKKLKEK
jgi:hypothetical protein